MATLPPLQIGHELTVAWMAALHKAIYGGDPTFEQIVGKMLAALGSQLAGDGRADAGDAEFKLLQDRLKLLGLNFERSEVKTEELSVPSAPGPQPTKRYCFRAPDIGPICVTIPTHFNERS